MSRTDPTDRLPTTIDGEVIEELDPIPARLHHGEVATVLSPSRSLASPSAAALPAVQAAAAAATGFVAGAATLALVRRRSSRRLARGRAPRRAPQRQSIVDSRSFLVDVHLLAKPGD